MPNGSSAGGDNRWTRGFNAAKNRAQNAATRVANAPKNAAESIKNGVSYKADVVSHGIKNKVNNAAQPFRNAAEFGRDFASSKGIKGKASFLGRSASRKFKQTDLFKRLQQVFLKIQKIATWIASHAYPIAIITAIAVVLYSVTIFIISVVQAVSPTPHYYCDTEASSSLKKTAVYQQYCANGKSFELDNLNGHYIIQDGSGPCTDCATANMFMRYYTLKGLNFFDYLWDNTGQYSMNGQTLRSSLTTSSVTLRKAINGNARGSTSTTCKFGLANGARSFASRNGIVSWTMANWGYLRDESLDLETWEATSDYYMSNASSDKWVFDLSVPNKGVGSTWAAYWEQMLQIEDIIAQEVTYSGSNITGDTIKDLFNSTNICSEAGILLYYNYGSGKDHAVLLTKYEDGYWYIIDSAKGLSGGYEGPMDGSNHFAIHDSQLSTLLNSGQNSYGGITINLISYIAEVM